ncbi:uncharacterized protein LOC143603486 [Bidens hawaiensis]|uniref:uncharacterized protein LOC143603486 n=1 Tax=Bidens hawaiensis TaxID=980011 RepID=UPI0040495CFB
MEIESKNGSKIRLQTPSEPIDFGRRGLGFTPTDRTVSRHHISFNLHENRAIIHFQVKGKNPIWVRHCTEGEIRVYRRSERGELKPGDSFCVSSKTPVWFNLKRIVSEDEDGNDLDSEVGFDEVLAEVSGIDHDEIETGDLSDIDPVKEFNFAVMGHEFDCYTKKLIRDIRNWNWFLEEPNKDSDDEDEEKSRKGARKKRKKGGKRDDDEDDVWTGESEEDVEVMKKMRNDPKPKYSTRSKDKSKKGAGASKRDKDDVKMKAARDDDEEEDEDDEDEGDETLGGFIVDDEDVGEGDEDDEEEEFEEDEDDE